MGASVGRPGWALAVALLLAAAIPCHPASADDPKPKIPSRAAEHFTNGFFEAAKGNYDDAVREYRKAIEIYPQYAEAHHNLGMILQQAGQLDLAVEHFRTALQCPGLEKAWMVHNSLGIALENKGDLDGAVSAYRKAIELDPRPAFPLHNLALALAKKGDLAGALEAIRKAAELAPLDPRIRTNREILERRARDKPAAAAPPTQPTSTLPPTPSAVPAGAPSEPHEPAAGAAPPAPEPERPLAFETGSFWRLAEEASSFVRLNAAGIEGLQARMEWEDNVEGTAADLAEADLARVRTLDGQAQRQSSPSVGGRDAAAYSYALSPFGAAVYTHVVVVVHEGRGYRFALSGAESLYAQGEAPFRALLESVRFK
jgi:tetratricopeptide (TPR) repeat protein